MRRWDGCADGCADGPWGRASSHPRAVDAHGCHRRSKTTRADTQDAEQGQRGGDARPGERGDDLREQEDLLVGGREHPRVLPRRHVAQARGTEPHPRGAGRRDRGVHG